SSTDGGGPVTSASSTNTAISRSPTGSRTSSSPVASGSHPSTWRTRSSTTRASRKPVIGVPDEKWDERPVAYVVAADGAEVTREDIISTLGERFAKWQMPDEVNVVDEMPRTSVGKLDKKLLRKNWDEK